MADSEALINQTHEDVRYVMGRVSEIDRDVNRLATAVERLNTNLEWHNRIAAVVGGFVVVTLLPAFLWFAKELYDLHGAVEGLKPMQSLLESIAAKLLQ